MTSQLELVTNQFYESLALAEDKTYKRLAVAHMRTIDAFSKQLDKVNAIIAKDSALGLDSGMYILQQQRLAAMITQAAEEFEKFGAQVALELTKAQKEAVDLAKQYAPAAIGASLGDNPAAVLSFATLPEPAIQQFVGTLGDGSPLRTITESFGQEASVELNRTLLEGVATGLNPLEIGRRMSAAVKDLGLPRARTIARTEMLRAYRESNRRIFQENADIVKGWRWRAACDRRTCPCCWAMHGREFKLSESMATHPNCRCTPVPITYTWKELGFDIEEIPQSPVFRPGREIFRELRVEDQQFVLGKAGYTLYKNKLATLDDFVLDTYSPDWGYGRTTRSISSIAGPKNVKQLTKGIVPSNLQPSNFRIQLPEIGDKFISPKTKLKDMVGEKKLLQSEADDILAQIDAGSFIDPGDAELAADKIYEKVMENFHLKAKEALDLDVITFDEWNELITESLDGKITREVYDTTSDALDSLISAKKGQIQHEYDLAKKTLIDELDKAKLYGNIDDVSYDTMLQDIADQLYDKNFIDNLAAQFSKTNSVNNPMKIAETALDEVYQLGAMDDVKYGLFKNEFLSGQIGPNEAKKLKKMFDDLIDYNKPITDPYISLPNEWNKIGELYNNGKLKFSEYDALYQDVLQGKYSKKTLTEKINDLDTQLKNKVTKTSQELLDELDKTYAPQSYKDAFKQQYKSKSINKEQMQAAIDDLKIQYPQPPAYTPPPAPITPPYPGGVANKVGIPNPSQLNKIGDLGGSTGAELHADALGNRFVVKRGSSPEHLFEESLSDSLYELLGVDVPEHEVFGLASPTKVSRFIDGRTLNKLTGYERQAAEQALRERFAADALLGNWDVIGLSEDNVLIDAFGKVYRIDNGGALRFRAQGAKKTAQQWNKTVDELVTMRDPTKTSGKIFGKLTDDEVADQINKFIVPNRSKILQRVANDPDLKDVLEGRIDYLEDWANNVKGVKTITQPTFSSGYDAYQHLLNQYYSGIMDYAEFKKFKNKWFNVGKYKYNKYYSEQDFIKDVEKKLGINQTPIKAGTKLPYKKHVQALDDLKALGKISQQEYDNVLDHYAKGIYKNKDVENFINAKQLQIGQQGGAPMPHPRTFRNQFDRNGFMSPDYSSSNNRGETWFRQWERSLSAKGRADIKDYTGSLYRDLNKWLRMGRPDQATWSAKRVYRYHGDVSVLEKAAQNVDDALKTARAQEPINVIRHSTANYSYADAWANPKVGETLWDDGYMSTTVKNQGAGSFNSPCSSADARAFELVLNIPVGGNAMYIKPISNVSSEQEVMVGRGVRMLVLDVEDFTDKCGGIAKRIFAELIV
jgi:SPP1 gp7 family putative phage head morphogenesis protein